jgi:hypothetical protein
LASYFSDRISLFLPRPASDGNPSTDASHIAGIIDVSHHVGSLASFDWLKGGEMMALKMNDSLWGGAGVRAQQMKRIHSFICILE